ncbi:hypothetical protein GGI20_002185 [Coemansia sp. BCRC 34301]|nr:hypothetical protein GGI20_002185 [Coemansia sp. BCRC 34301]
MWWNREEKSDLPIATRVLHAFKRNSMSLAIVVVFGIVIAGVVLGVVYAPSLKSGAAADNDVSSSNTEPLTLTQTTYSSTTDTLSETATDESIELITDQTTTELSSLPSSPPPVVYPHVPVPSSPPNTVPNNGGAPAGGRPLWGLTYSPYNTDGSCPDVNTVAGQLQKVAAATGHIRLYSSDCSQLSSVLQAITRNNIALDVYAGIWLAAGPSRMQADLDQFVAAAKTFGTSLIKGLSVGNEDISNGMSEATLIGYINQVRSRLQAEGLSGIPIYTTEQDAKFSRAMAAASDVVQINVHTIFDGYFANMDASVQSVIQRANHIKNNIAGDKLVRFGESGWSSAGNTGPSPLTLANEIAYAQKFKCAAAAAGYEYFYFEAKDAQWKAGAVQSEQNFGIFNAGFTPKFDFSLLNNC